MDELVKFSLLPPEERKPKRRINYKGIPKCKEPYFARLKREDPEKLAQIAKAASEKSKLNPPKYVKGKPPGMSDRAWAISQDDARKLAHKVYKIMDKEGSLPENPIAREAMKNAMELLAQDNSTKDKISLIRVLLEYNMAKPAATQNVNLRTAEDYLDDLAAEDDAETK